ncbi:hypothetical protein CK203_038467 [Vitis vinifera]|uniref:Uncharacterized protein n=1 Tax=Vitis vinifera TaxID=29760 RepID=A0A438IRS1_VITVI|nr:hypothetical protein CK203_038467 [Vitis vinifera]
MWLKVDGFKDLVKGLYSFILASNLKVLMEDLKAWNKGVCGNVCSLINGEWVMEELEIPTKIVNYFKQLLSEPMGEWRSNINGLSLNLLSIENSVKLEKAFTKKVFEALMDLNGDKAPSPDGFPLAFWQHC